MTNTSSTSPYRPSGKNDAPPCEEFTGPEGLAVRVRATDWLVMEPWWLFFTIRALFAALCYLQGWTWGGWLLLGAILPETGYRLKVQRYERKIAQYESHLRDVDGGLVELIAELTNARAMRGRTWRDRPGG